MSAQKTPRHIHINGLDYVWKASMIDAQYTLIKVWLDGNTYKASPILVRCRFDDPWQNFGPLINASVTAAGRRRIRDIFQLEPITPGLIRRIVEAARMAGWRPDMGHEPAHFEWVSGGELRPVDDATQPGEDPFGVLRAN